MAEPQLQPLPVERATSEPRLDKYKVLRAATELEEFTVRDLAGNTGVDAAYIHKLISDSAKGLKGLVEELEPIPMPRGRPPMRFRIVPELRAQVQKELDALLADLTPQRRTTEPPPTALLAAEHDLFDKIPAAKSPGERSALLKNTALILEGPAAQGGARWAAARVLLRLAELGSAVVYKSRGDWYVQVSRLGLELFQLYKDLDAEYQVTITKWLTEGPIGQFLKSPPLPETMASLTVIPSQSECAPRTDVCRFLDNGRVQQVDLVQTDAPKARSVAEQVARAVALAAPQLAVRRREASGGPPEPTGSARAVLVACDSESGQSNRSVWNGVFEVVEQWVQIACAVYVLDANYSPDFRQQVFLRKARYVPDATDLEANTLFQAIPALAAKDEGV
jgi:hypothetical protein